LDCSTEFGNEIDEDIDSHTKFFGQYTGCDGQENKGFFSLDL
jgi:hypothetical protein